MANNYQIYLNKQWCERKFYESKSGIQAVRSQPRKIQEIFAIPDEAVKAGLLWAIKVCYNQQFYRLCINLNKSFETMHPESGDAKNFALGNTKLFYIINHGL